MRIFDTDNWKEIGSSLARNKTRTFLTAFGIFWGTLMLSLLWGAGQGARRMMYSNFEGFASNSAVIFSNRTQMPYKGFKKGMWWSLTTEDVASLRRNVPELEVVTPLIEFSANISYKDKSKEASYMGVEPNYTQAMTPLIRQGRFINEIDMVNAERVCVLGENLANNIFAGADPLGKIVNINNIFYRVIGVCAQKTEVSIGGNLDEAIVVPITTARAAYNYGNRCSYVMLVADSDHRPAELRPKIFQAVRKNHPLNPDDINALAFWDVSEMFEQISQLFTGLDLLVLFVGFSSLLAGVIGVGNIMWVIVKERTKEFGIRRAIGAKPKTVLMQILSESAVLTIIAGMTGVVAAVGILQVATSAIGDMMASGGMPKGMVVDFQLSFPHALVILVLFLVLGTLAGSIPAIKAMRIKPIEALNDK